MAIALGYTRLSDWEQRLIDQQSTHPLRPLSLSDQTSRLRRGCQAAGHQLHDEIPTDHAPSGLDPAWGGPPALTGVARPGQTRLLELQRQFPAAPIAVEALDRLACSVQETDWLLRRRPGAPHFLSLWEALCTFDQIGLAQATQFLAGAAALRRARRTGTPPQPQPPSGQIANRRAFNAGLEWETRAVRLRARDSLEARRRQGLPTGRPALASQPQLARRVAAMRAKGMTLQAIADTLNNERIPTLRGGTSWRRSALQHLPPNPDQADDLTFL